MSISIIKKQALRALKGQWGLGVSLTLMVFLISAILPTIVEITLSGGFSNWLWQDTVPLYASLIGTLISIALVPLSIAVLWFFLALVRLEGPEITDVFAVFTNGRTFIRLIGVSLLIGIFVSLWSLLLFIPGIIKSLSYSQTYLLLKDHPEYSLLEAITESRKRMNGYKWKYFLLNLSFIGWGILCLLSFGIGFLWLSPYISTANATFYNELINKQDQFTEEAPL